jgi:hypothetical protein
MTNSRHHTQRPSQKQLRYLRDLARSRGQTFVMPHTIGEASEQIERLRSQRPLTRAERRLASYADRLEIADRRAFATAVRPDEVIGYGASARWAR